MRRNLNRTVQAIFCGSAIAFGAASNAAAQAECQLDRRPSDREAHCIEIGDKRFRIPKGHFALWQIGPGDTPDTMSDEFRGKISIFMFVSDLPDLKPIGRGDERDLRYRVTTFVMRDSRTSPKSIRSILIGKKISAVWMDGWESRTAHRKTGLTLHQREKTIHLFANGGAITHLIRESPQENMYSCIFEYSEDIVLATDVPRESRSDVCMIAFRVAEKLKQFEY